jgi:hypothetical protein
MFGYGEFNEAAAIKFAFQVSYNDDWELVIRYVTMSIIAENKIALALLKIKS